MFWFLTTIPTETHANKLNHRTFFAIFILYIYKHFTNIGTIVLKLIVYTHIFN